MIDKENQKETYVPDASELLRKFNQKFVYSPLGETDLEEGCPNFGGGPVVSDEEFPDLLQDESSFIEPEPMPVKNQLPYVWPRAMDRMQAIGRIIKAAQQRDNFGAEKYGTRLQPFNGRDPLVDAFQEGLDQLVYIEQELCERPFKNAVIAVAVELAASTDTQLTNQLLVKLKERVSVLLSAQCKTVD